MFDIFFLGYFVTFIVELGLSVNLKLTKILGSETAERLVLINILRDSLGISGTVN